MDEFARFGALSFDCYGTLIDWEKGIVLELRRWAGTHDLDFPDDTLLRMFAEVETAVQAAQRPALAYPEVLAETLRLIGRRLGAPVSASEADSFGTSVGRWPEFADSHNALEKLAGRFKLIIVSNIDRASFAASQTRSGVSFDRVITAEEVGAYKPADPHFETLLASLDEFGIDRGALLHVAQSIYHDHEPARRFGIESAWIDRRGARRGWGATPPPQTGEATPARRFPSMEAFAAAALT